MTLILRSKNDPHSRRIMTGVIFLRRIMTPGHYSTGVIIRRYTGDAFTKFTVFHYLSYLLKQFQLFRLPKRSTPIQRFSNISLFFIRNYRLELGIVFFGLLYIFNHCTSYM